MTEVIFCVRGVISPDEAGTGDVAWLRYSGTRRRKSEPTVNTNFNLHRRASPRSYLRGALGETPEVYSLPRIGYRHFICLSRRCLHSSGGDHRIGCPHSLVEDSAHRACASRCSSVRLDVELNSRGSRVRGYLLCRSWDVEGVQATFTCRAISHTKPASSRAMAIQILFWWSLRELKRR
jgi:hypothetical protein